MMEANSSSEVLVKELMKHVDALQKENKELNERVSHLEVELGAKDAEKSMALKKQQAYVKELKKIAQEEKKRAEALERTREGSITPSLVLGDNGSYRTRSIQDGQESVSSMNLFESDNIELINRIADLQRNYGEALHKISLLESTAMQLERENREKSEVIEEWVRARPLPPTAITTRATPTSTVSTPRALSGLRKLMGMGESTSAATNDVMEMNKKLQRLLEETLSKNLILQRDLQTLLERTEM